MGKIMVDLGSRIVVVDNCTKTTVKVMADLANKWLKEREEKKAGAVSVSSSVSGKADSLDKLEKLADLKDKGVLSDEEFAEAKKKILAAL